MMFGALRKTTSSRYAYTTPTRTRTRTRVGPITTTRSASLLPHQRFVSVMPTVMDMDGWMDGSCRTWAWAWHMAVCDLDFMTDHHGTSQSASQQFMGWVDHKREVRLCIAQHIYRQIFAISLQRDMKLQGYHYQLGSVDSPVCITHARYDTF